MKAGKHQSCYQRCCSLRWKLPDRAQSFSVTEQINAKFLLVSKIKIMGMLLNVVHGQVQKM